MLESGTENIKTQQVKQNLCRVMIQNVNLNLLPQQMLFNSLFLQSSVI